jgi:hypothetical protein
MGSRFLKYGISDIKRMVRVPVLLIAILYPVIIAVALLFVHWYISDLNEIENVKTCLQYFSLIAVTLISSIPFVYGLIFSYIRITEYSSGEAERDEIIKSDFKTIFITRMAFSSILSFIWVLPVIFLTGAVSTEGWLRSIYAAALLALMAPFILAFSAGFARNIMQWRFISLISALFLLALPSGLLLHHPWNYVTFFSPFYWLGWAWIIASPEESIMYGLICLAAASGGALVFYRRYIRNIRDI